MADSSVELGAAHAGKIAKCSASLASGVLCQKLGNLIGVFLNGVVFALTSLAALAILFILRT